MKRLLVCTDLTESSDMIVKAAEELRARNNCQTDFLYVSELPFHITDVLNENLKKSISEIFFRDLPKTLEAKLLDQLKRCQAIGKAIIRKGRIYSEILNLANTGNYDLIVMGHGRTSMVLQLIGSNAYKVISSCPIPLLIMKTEPKWDKVVGLVDDSPEMESIIIGTYDFARNFRCASSSLLSVWFDIPEPFGDSSKGFELEQKIKQEAAFYADEAKPSMVRVEPTRELQVAYRINELLKDEKAGTIVLKRSSGSRAKLYIGSTTKRLTEIFDGNLLILPATQKN